MILIPEPSILTPLQRVFLEEHGNKTDKNNQKQGLLEDGNGPKLGLPNAAPSAELMLDFHPPLGMPQRGYDHFDSLLNGPGQRADPHGPSLPKPLLEGAPNPANNARAAMFKGVGGLPEFRGEEAGILSPHQHPSPPLLVSPPQREPMLPNGVLLGEARCDNGVRA